jgi:hypothetical protein
MVAWLFQALWTEHYPHRAWIPMSIICVTGGEPLVWKELDELVAATPQHFWTRPSSRVLTAFVRSEAWNLGGLRVALREPDKTLSAGRPPAVVTAPASPQSTLGLDP